MIPSGFIEVTAQYDGRKALIRASLIEGVTDNAESWDGKECYKPACVTIFYSGRHLNVVDSYDDICDMIYKAEL